MLLCRTQRRGVPRYGVAVHVLLFPKSTGRTLEFAFWAVFGCHVEGGWGAGQGRRGTTWRPRSYLLGSPTGRRCPADPAVPSHVTAGSRPAGAEGRAPRLPVTGDLQLLAALQVRWGDQGVSSSQPEVQARVTCDLCALSCRCSSLLCFGVEVRAGAVTVT